MVIYADSDYIKAYTYLNGSIGDDYLRVSMLTAQDKWIRPYLGDSLDAYLKAQIQAGTLSGNYETLVNTYIKPAFAWFTVVEYLPNALVKIDNSGLVQRISDDTTPATNADKNRLVNQATDNGEMYRQKLVDYLCANSTLFPQFSDNVFPENSPIYDNYQNAGMTVSKGHNRAKWGERRDPIYDVR